MFGRCRSFKFANGLKTEPLFLTAPAVGITQALFSLSSSRALRWFWYKPVDPLNYQTVRTETGYAATTCHAMSGTELCYAAIRLMRTGTWT
eukprot:1674613-Rhodomonas_salina.1